jgi:hypothetical protein
MPGVERAVRTVAVIERVYNRCDRAARQKPESRKAEAKRAAHEEAAIKAQVSLASTLRWGDEHRQALGQWWGAAQKATETRAPQTATASENPAPISIETSDTPPKTARVIYTDLIDDIEATRAELALKRRSAAQIPIPPLRGPPPRSG